MLYSEKISLHLGLKEPVRILHLTDPHLTLADDDDGDSMKAHAEGRRQVFHPDSPDQEKSSEHYLEEAMAYGKNFDLTVITGDVLDFTSHANQVTAKRILDRYDYLFCAGNHEFSPRVGIPDSFEYRKKIESQIQINFHGNFVFDNRIVGGVNIISMDNSQYIWTPEQFELLKEEVQRGYPCLLFCHVPLSDPYMNHHPSHANLQVSEECIRVTREVNQYIADAAGIKAVFAGHYHKSMCECLPNGKACYILGGLFSGIVGEISVD